jgi:hypothetical protein
MATQNGLFGKRQAPEPQIDEQSLENMRRMRTLEERYTTLERRSQITEENMIAHHRKISSDIKELNQDLRDVRKLVMDFSERFDSLLKELQGFARTEDVEVLKKYISYWEPVNFVTRNEVERIISDILQEKQAE